MDFKTSPEAVRLAVMLQGKRATLGTTARCLGARCGGLSSGRAPTISPIQWHSVRAPIPSICATSRTARSRPSRAASASAGLDAAQPKAGLVLHRRREFLEPRASQLLEAPGFQRCAATIPAVPGTCRHRVSSESPPIRRSPQNFFEIRLQAIAGRGVLEALAGCVSLFPGVFCRYRCQRTAARGLGVTYPQRSGGKPPQPGLSTGILLYRVPVLAHHI